MKSSFFTVLPYLIEIKPATKTVHVTETATPVAEWNKATVIPAEAFDQQYQWILASGAMPVEARSIIGSAIKSILLYQRSYLEVLRLPGSSSFKDRKTEEETANDRNQIAS